MSQRKNETKSEYNARMNEIMKTKYYRRRGQAIEFLGGKCIDCGHLENLEFDHKNPSDKEYNISQIFSSHSIEKVQREVEKCVLRCIPCHGHMTTLQRLQNTNLLLPI